MKRWQVAQRTSTGQFKPGASGNPAGRKPGLAAVRHQLEPHRKDLVQKLLSMALAGNEAALRIVFDRLAPLPRAQFEPTVIPGISPDKSMAENARAIVSAAGTGDISPDAAAAMLGAMADALRIVDADELEKRLRLMEGRA
jgi:hypothetical protein